MKIKILTILTLVFLVTVYGHCPANFSTGTENYLTLNPFTGINFIMSTNPGYIQKVQARGKYINFKTKFYNLHDRTIINEIGTDINIDITNLQAHCGFSYNSYPKDYSPQNICNHTTILNEPITGSYNYCHLVVVLSIFDEQDNNEETRLKFRFDDKTPETKVFINLKVEEEAAYLSIQPGPIPLRPPILVLTTLKTTQNSTTQNDKTTNNTVDFTTQNHSTNQTDSTTQKIALKRVLKPVETEPTTTTKSSYSQKPTIQNKTKNKDKIKPPDTNTMIFIIVGLVVIFIIIIVSFIVVNRIKKKYKKVNQEDTIVYYN